MGYENSNFHGKMGLYHYIYRIDMPYEFHSECLSSKMKKIKRLCENAPYTLKLR